MTIRGVEKNIWSKTYNFLADNEADELSVLLPPLVSIFLFGLYIKHEADESYAVIWAVTICGLMILGGTWRALRKKSVLAPIVAMTVGAVVGFGASQGPATVFATTVPPATPAFHGQLAEFGIYAYSLPALVGLGIRGFRKDACAPGLIIRKYLAAFVILLVVAADIGLPILTSTYSLIARLIW